MTETIKLSIGTYAMEATTELETYLRKWYPSAKVIYNSTKNEPDAPSDLIEVLIDIDGHKHFIQMSVAFIHGLKDASGIQIIPAKIIVDKTSVTSWKDKS